MSKILDRNFEYHTAEESRKPGYLRRKFEKMRRQQKPKKTRPVAAVRILRTGTGGNK